MTRERFSDRCISTSAVLLVAFSVLLVGAVPGQAAGVPTTAAAYGSNGVSASVRAVQPAVSGLFQIQAPRVWVDAFDVSGLPGKNGVPDFLDSWNAFSARTSSAILKNGYAFTTIDVLRHEVLYAGVERASAGGPSSAVLEFSQNVGERTLGDLRILVEIDAAGSVGAVRFESYAADAKGARFLPVAILAGEGCNDAGSACAVSNGALVEFGYNLTALGKPDKEFSGIQLRTPEDHTVGIFSINPVSLPAVTCPSNLNSCTANDVTTTVKGVTILNNDLCTSLTDTIQLRITTAYASTSNERFDLGLFVSRDGGTVREPSTALACSGAAAQAGQGDNLAYPDGDTDLFLSIDPTGHSLTPSTTDTCGDLRASAGPVDWTVDATVACNIVSGALRIPSCRVWEQNANHKTSCQTLQQAGTGSKCDCTDLVVTTQLNPCATTVCNDNNACTDDSCTVVGTTGDLSAECVYTNNTEACSDSNACTSGDICSGGSCQPGSPVTPTDDGNVCTTDTCDPATGTVHTNNTAACSDGNACTTGDACSAGSCAGGSAANCNDGNVCTDDSCNPASGCVNTNNTNPCSDGNACTTNDTCAAGSCVGGSAPNCNDGNVCTDDSCDPASGCASTNNTNPCSDGNACTTGDVCSAGSCAGGSAPNCNDENVCTDDSCDPASGCVNADNTNPCSDGNACTTNDTCAAGSCAGGSAPNCNDGNVCTDDSCDPASGCVTTNNTAPCNADHNQCTGPDHCSDGVCVAGAPVVIPD
jgi:hypothetical protein